MTPFDPGITDVFAINLSMIIAKYAIIGKFSAGFIESLKLWLHLDEKMGPHTRDWAYPLLALGVITASTFGVHLLSPATIWSSQLIREIIIATIATWAGLVGLVRRENALADRSSSTVVVDTMPTVIKTEIPG